jgi:serine/threonine protein kinase
MEKFTEKYKKIKVIGSGQFGKAILVEDRTTGLPAVVKVSALLKNHYHDMETLENEIRIMQTLDHPYVVRIIDHLKLQKSICIVMQFAESTDLITTSGRSRS